MANLNKCYIIGRLTHDPEVRHTPSGKQVTTLSIAVNRDTKDAQGNKQQETSFLSVTCLGKIAELAAQYLSRGREVMVEGRLKMQQWQDKQTGQNRTRLDIIAENLQFLGGGAPTGQQPQNSEPRQQQRGNSQTTSKHHQNGNGNQQQKRQQPPPPAPCGDDDFPNPYEDDDIPF